MARVDFGSEIVWQPTPAYVEGSRLRRFMERHDIATLDELMRRSTGNLEGVAWFWDAVLDDLEVAFYKPYQRVLDTSAGIPWARWCVGGQLNIVHNCLDKWIGTPTQNRAAVRWEGEEGDVRILTYSDLYRQVNRLANALRELGLGKGDAVGLYMPMTPEIVIALLAVVKIGGVVLPLFSGYGAAAVATRLADADARALFTADGFYRRGKIVDMKATADEALAQAPTVERVIVLQRVGQTVPWAEERDRWWDDVLTNQSPQAPTERTDAEDRLMIIYTSGTTGRPKGAVHTHCGFPVKSAQDMAHGLDVQPFDTLYWVTDMGWMMGPWEVFGTTLLGATMVLYDGALDYPGPDRLWSLVERHGVTVLGVSPTLVRALMARGAEAEVHVRRHDLSSLRVLGSTGEAWNPEPWHWFFHTVGDGQRPIINYSGGTEISGGIVMGNVLTPLKPCAFSGPVPGMAADVVDDEGRSVRGQVGELVVRQPWIGMTRGFWKDPERYLQTYWSRFSDVWVHGDWAAVDDDGLWYILGRSDDTIKVAGKRLGPAEVESALVEHPAVTEAAAIGVPDPQKGQALVAFCVLRPGYAVQDALRQALADQIVAQLGKPFKPREVVLVSDLPRTRNAKVMRRVIRTAYLGQDPGDLSALVNPEAVAEIRRQGEAKNKDESQRKV